MPIKNACARFRRHPDTLAYSLLTTPYLLVGILGGSYVLFCGLPVPPLLFSIEGGIPQSGAVFGTVLYYREGKNMSNENPRGKPGGCEGVGRVCLS